MPGQIQFCDKKDMKKNFSTYGWLAAVPLLFLGVFYFYPLLNILRFSLMPEGKLDLMPIMPLVTSGYYIKTLWFTFWQAALSTVLTLALALPCAMVFIRFDFSGKSLIQSLVTVPFVLPTVVVAAAFKSFLGDYGIVNSILTEWLHLPPFHLNHSVWFILAAHVFYNFAVAFRIIVGFGNHLDPSLVHAAKVLGASPWKAFCKITFPILAPALLSASLLIFVFCFSSFGVVLILGGPRIGTIEVEIYRQAVNLFNLPMAAALSAIQIMFTFACLSIYTGFQKKTHVTATSQAYSTEPQRPSGFFQYLVICVCIGSMGIFIVSPLAALIFQSLFDETGFSFANYRMLFEDSYQSLFYVPPIQALFNSLGVASCTLVISLGIGFPAAVYIARSKTRVSTFLDPLFMLPLSTSAVTLGFGFIITLDKPPLNLRGSWILLPIAHALVAFPFVVRCLLPALRSIGEQLRESAAILGASPFNVWKSIDLPIVARSLLAASVFSFTISMGEFGATSFIARPQIPTLPVAIFRFLGTPGAANYGQAMAMSSLLMIITASGFMFLDRIMKRPQGVF